MHEGWKRNLVFEKVLFMKGWQLDDMDWQHLYHYSWMGLGKEAAT